MCVCMYVCMCACMHLCIHMLANASEAWGRGQGVFPQPLTKLSIQSVATESKLKLTAMKVYRKRLLCLSGRITEALRSGVTLCQLDT